MHFQGNSGRKSPTEGNFKALTPKRHDQYLKNHVFSVLSITKPLIFPVSKAMGFTETLRSKAPGDDLKIDFTLLMKKRVKTVFDSLSNRKKNDIIYVVKDVTI